MRMPASPTPAIVDCPTCGKRFYCDPGGRCWCKSVPSVGPAPQRQEGSAQTCYCPDCLDETTP